MKKAKILYGSDELAKGSYATRIADGYENVAIIDLQDTGFKKHLEPYYFVDQLSPDTDLIVYLNVPTGYPFEYFLSMISEDGFLVNKKCEALFRINPDLVVVTKEKPVLSGYSYDLRFDLLEFKAEPTPEKKLIERMDSGMLVINITPWRKWPYYLYVTCRRWDFRLEILPF